MAPSFGRCLAAPGQHWLALVAGTRRSVKSLIQAPVRRFVGAGRRIWEHGKSLARAVSLGLGLTIGMKCEGLDAD
jgi:hypothetical protein